ncbi:MAG: BON domain-containing protein [Chloroflexi bacterium]|nr:MAG: BON domain-containing protein [Chloroflexota bacterium]
MSPHRRNDDDWAEQVPEDRTDLPYRDYGWEANQSSLPEFRDPSVHRTPEEEKRWRQKNRLYTRQVSGMQDWNMPGPYTGKGPRGYKRSDDMIKEGVCERLTQHGYIDPTDIEVEVNDGEITLNGEVEDRTMKRLAEDLAESVTGVIDIHNRLKVRNRTPRSGWIDRVGRSGVYPASGPMPPRDAEIRGMMEWGQGERGAAGYYDSGESELRIGRRRR